MKHNEQQQTGNPKPSGNLAYYNSIEEKEKMSRSVPYDGMYDSTIERIIDVLQEEISKRS